MNTSIQTKVLRIILFALREFGEKDGILSKIVLELLEKEHIKHEKKWVKTPEGQAWLNDKPKEINS